MIVRPESVTYELLLTAETALSHHDPAIQQDSNRLLFNRQKQLLREARTFVAPAPQVMEAIAQKHLIPVDLRGLFADITFAEFVAITLARLFLDIYNNRNSGEGEGLFSGMERYEMLEARLRLAAISATTLRDWWDRLTRSLQVGIHPQERDVELLDLLTLPIGIQQLVLRAMVNDYRSIIALARLWHTTMKLRNERYAQAVGREALIDPLCALQFPPMATMDVDVPLIAEVPVVSSNSLRHQVVREPSWLHLQLMLGLKANEPGKGPVPPGVEAIFYNGGNIAAGAKQPTNAFSLAQRVRALYPSLDLLGGVTDSFDLGESRLRVVGWLVCRENREALRGSPAYDLPNAALSVYDMLDDTAITRQAGRVGQGQMIVNMETLATGVQIVCRLSLLPQTNELTHGALIAAVKTFLSQNDTIGGAAARGLGVCRGEWLQTALPPEELCQKYEDYLTANREALLAGMVDGTLGTACKIIS